MLEDFWILGFSPWFGHCFRFTGLGFCPGLGGVRVQGFEMFPGFAGAFRSRSVRFLLSEAQSVHVGIWDILGP